MLLLQYATPGWLAAIAVLSVSLYSVALVVYRLFFSPIRRFPGPRLAAATFWYEFYYDVVLGGQYTFHIARLHEKYGPVVRINPHELHVHEFDFYNQLYTAGGRTRHKWYWASRAFGADFSTFATERHEDHRIRRSALNPSFSTAQVRKLEPLIQGRVDSVMKRVRQFKADGSVLPLDVMFGAFSADVITEYAFRRPGRKVEAPDFDDDFHTACINGGKQLFLTRQFPWLLKVVRTIPPHMTLKFNPSMSSFFAMHKDIAMQVRSVLDDPSPANKAPTVFHKILDSKIPEHEKSFNRLASDAGSLVGAATITTSWSLTHAVFHLLSNPSCLKRLKTELADAFTPGSNDDRNETILPILEQLPYFTAVIQEALRLSVGVSTRLSRVAPDEVLTVKDSAKSDGEWKIPPSTPVSMSQQLILYDEHIFPSASAFRPERWIEDPGLIRYQVAFSKGSRACLGKHLALAELYLLLGRLFSSYGSPEVRMPGDLGYLELYETDKSDIECAVDAFLPLPKVGSKGVRCRVLTWEDEK
ncbi:cytochrome P450 [Aspergillus glaucus CBS 516.65]|uniref:Cytochrome P450 n=1 Tax=Aspergillus glaucus CBS 516.65 TaxID=1160497 RepID=A0A1L9VI56_ASPGL|nr:hypothetical protein ASPGLDRAFT_58691 [Aspergillus glaucus CBS 516.65]OJJ83618.1 hypothetical protein ASPGLDRAFT_58691 [Aspergillus glaucus CBS 516.65]